MLIGLLLTLLLLKFSPSLIWSLELTRQCALASDLSSLKTVAGVWGQAGILITNNHSGLSLQPRKRRKTTIKTPLPRKEEVFITPNIIVEKQSRVPSVLKLKQMSALNQSRALQETISFYAKNLSLRGLMHFLVAAIMPRLITPEPGERE